MEQKQIKQLKKGDLFTLTQVEFPSERQVWVRGEYERSSKKYSCIKFSDCCHENFMKGDRLVWVCFNF